MSTVYRVGVFPQFASSFRALEHPEDRCPARSDALPVGLTEARRFDGHTDDLIQRQARQSERRIAEEFEVEHRTHGARSHSTNPASNKQPTAVGEGSKRLFSVQRPDDSVDEVGESHDREQNARRADPRPTRNPELGTWERAGRKCHGHHRHVHRSGSSSRVGGLRLRKALLTLPLPKDRNSLSNGNMTGGH